MKAFNFIKSNPPLNLFKDKIFKKFLKAKKVSIHVAHAWKVGEIVEVDFHRFEDFIKIKKGLKNLLKNDKELPLHIGLHPKIDEAVHYRLQGYEVEFTLDIGMKV